MFITQTEQRSIAEKQTFVNMTTPFSAKMSQITNKDEKTAPND
jgi:hypothetical protein